MKMMEEEGPANMYCNIKIHSVDKLSNYGFVQLSHRLTEEHSSASMVHPLGLLTDYIQ